MEMVAVIRTIVCLVSLLLVFSSGAHAQEDALLFYLSGDGDGNGFTADYANGQGIPSYLSDYTIIEDGAVGNAFSAPHTESKLMSYLAPGNIYAERGTIAFFWRARDPLTELPFKLFYVSFCEHSSLDMTWLRIDYNGENGFNGLVTDLNMGRARASYTPSSAPAPDQWSHIAFSWDENYGVRLHVDGKLVAEDRKKMTLNAGLGLFQPHGRFSTPGTVTSNCGLVRGGDMDEIHIYGVMLSDREIQTLASGTSAVKAAPLVRSVSDPTYRDEWYFRYGFDTAMPPYLDGTVHSVRKVEVLEARDQKKWSWRANNGLRESTWPDAYNRSRIPGRMDYFVEPDWYCYSTSGKELNMSIPDEPWNHIEMTGAAYGEAIYQPFDSEHQIFREESLFRRPQGRERTFHHFQDTYTGGRIRYVNDVIETAIGEFNVYNVQHTVEPKGVTTMSYSIDTSADITRYPCVEPLATYVSRRYPPDERRMAVALPDRAPRSQAVERDTDGLPVLHVFIPCEFADEVTTEVGAYGGFMYTWDNMYGGLDGIAIDIPALDLEPVRDGLIPLSIQIKDPLWPNRFMMDFSFSVRPGEPKTLWFDLRDRVLPKESFYLVIAGGSPDFTADAFDGTDIRLVFKERADAIPEHEADRFAQVRDHYAANLSETFPRRRKLEYYERFRRDMDSIFSVNPDNEVARYYWTRYHRYQNTPTFTQPEAPAGVPLWAYRQIHILKEWRYFLNWWIDNRQIENGELGGGLSDDGDFTNCFPALALMSVDTEKITRSLSLLMDSYYTNGMFHNGLNSIMTDALHTSEEGTNVQSELMRLKYGDPKTMERMLESAARYPELVRVNDAGHRHFVTRMFSSTLIVEDPAYSWTSSMSYSILYPGITLVEYNGLPLTKQLLFDVGDGYLAHLKTDENGNQVIPREINFITDEGRYDSRSTFAPLFVVLNHWDKDGPYLDHLGGASSNAGASRTIDKQSLAASYGRTIKANEQAMYLGTEGFPWDDGPYISYGGIDSHRLGGPPVNRGHQFERHIVSWDFDKPDDAETLAILMPRPSATDFRVIACNIGRDTVSGTMTGWQVEPGTWDMTVGIDTNGDDVADTGITKSRVDFERSVATDVEFAPGVTTIIDMKLRKKGTAYWKRYDLGIGAYDITVSGSTVTATVHSLGSVASKASTIALVDADGGVIASAPIPALDAPVDFRPRTTDVRLTIPSGVDIQECSVCIDPDMDGLEITRLNNRVGLSTK
jgi:hypothetical protein